MATEPHDIPAAPGTLDPDALPWPDRPSKADLGAHALPLTYGGDITITEHDGEYQFHVHKGDAAFVLRMSVLDVWGMRAMAGDIVMARVSETER